MSLVEARDGILRTSFESVGELGTSLVEARDGILRTSSLILICS